MSRRATVLPVALALLTFGAAMLGTTAASAAEVPTAPAAILSLRLGGFEVDERSVTVDIEDVPSEATSVAVSVDGLDAANVAAPSSGALHVTLSIPGETARVGALALNAAGEVVASSAHKLKIQSSRFIPAYPRVSVYWESFAVPSQRVRLTTARASMAGARFGGRGCESTNLRAASEWRIVLPKALPNGRSRLAVWVANAWGVRTLSVPMWSLHWRPPTARAILVDKSDFTLYYTEKYRMHKVYPVATGMPGTPTRVGSYWLGSPRPAGGPWGVLRMALSKRKGTGALPPWGGYYIHGTNQPDSIGTQASHGCVRMFNSGVRDLSRHTRGRLTRVTIRP